MKFRNDIRNIAIIAHVDHGKTTLVDAMLKQSHIFRENQQMVDCVMDMGDLERERGITIMAKNTAITYRETKINIIDTPGHADFSGEVERVISMADGCLLLVDSVEGPMPQTKFVLRKALERGLKPIVVINKVDRPNSRVSEVLNMTQDLFLELATRPDQLDFPVLYSSGREGWAVTSLSEKGCNISLLLDAILENIPAPRIEEGPFQMLVSNLDYDNHKGRIAIGRIWRGSVKPKDTVVRIGTGGETVRYQISEVMTYLGLKRLDVECSSAGDIVAVAGVETVNIGDTLSDPVRQEAMPRIEIGEPTVEMSFGVNTSPFAGREGRFTTTRQLRDRLIRELDTNLSLRVQETDSPDKFLVKGRGELHLAVLVETMRREGYEFEVSKPEAITRMVDGQMMEPVEDLTLDVKEEAVGMLIEGLSQRQAQLTNMHNDGRGNVRMEFRIPTKGLIGFRAVFVNITRGEGIMNSVFHDYEKFHGSLPSTRMGVLVSSEEGEALTYGLNIAQGRGITFIGPNTQVYEGMIIGMNSKPQDIAINVTKEKKKTNVRASTSDIAIKLIPPEIMSLEQAMAFIADDELLEITPQSIRMRKRLLTETQRLRSQAAQRRVDAAVQVA